MRHMVYDYLPLGWHVFPCVQGRKRPVISDWVSDASNDPEKIKLWQWRFKASNWAILCGRLSKVVAIDVENEEGAKLLKKLGRPFGPSCETGSTKCGFHVYVRYPEDVGPLKSVVKIRNDDDRLLMELRGDHHSVLLPPSLDEEGRVRTWLRGMAPWELEVPPAPDWLIERMREPERKPYVPREITGLKAGYIKAAVRKEVDRLLVAPRHTRNHTLNECGYSLFRLVGECGADPHEIRDELLGAYVSLKPGCEHEARATLQSAARARGVRL